MTALSSTACIYESEHLKDLKCSPDGTRKGDALCIDGLWIYDPVDGTTTPDAGNNPGGDSGSDVVEPPLDTGDDVQDTGSDASADTSPNDTGNPDTGNPDTGNPDVGNPDTGNPDTGNPDTGNPDTGNPDVGEPDVGGAIGDGCQDATDCISGYCGDSDLCEEEPCQNGRLDVGEVDIDCGGTCTLACSNYKQVAAGGRHTCAIRADDSVMCWGHANQLLNVPPTTEKYKALTAGNRFVCGILRDMPEPDALNRSNVRCWGQLDDANDHGIFTPPTNLAFESINAGREHVCGIDATDAKLYCWGNNGQERANPAINPTSHDNGPWRQVSAGTQHSCATTTNNRYKCWGDHSESRRELGDRSFNKTFKHIVASVLHTCVIHTNDMVECFANKNPNIKKNVPSFTVSQIDSGNDYACVIRKSDDSLACWGDDKDGRINDVPATGKYVQISTGWEHACALSETSGVITCWGNTDNARYPDEFAAP